MKGKRIEKAKDFKGSMIRFFKELKSFRALVLIAISVSVASSILSICAPNILSNLTDTIRNGLMVNSKNIEIISNNIQNNNMNDITIDNVVITTKDQMEFINVMSSDKDIDKLPLNIKKIIEPKMNLNKVKSITLVILSIYLISALFNYIETISMAHVSNNFARKLRSGLSNKINKLPLKYFDKSSTGDILSRMTNDVDTIAQSMNNSLASLVSALTLFLGTIIMMFITNVVMAITAIISSLIGFIFMTVILTKSHKYFEMRQRELGNLNGHIEEIYSGLNVVKVYNGKREVNEKFDELNSNLYKANKMSHFLGGLMHPMMHLVGNLGYVAVCIVGALLTMNNVITFGVIVAFMLYVRLFINPLNEIAQSMTSIQSTAAAIERVYEFMDEEELNDESNLSDFLNKNKVKGNIEFRNVEFKYDGNENPTIKNFSANIKAGEKIAIVGPTGAGKTTMVNLLMKFYDIDSGDIIIDGKSIRNLTRENIHDLFTMVLQDTWVYEGTIKDNIIYNQKNVTDKKVKEVCEIVGLDHFIKTLPKGYNSMLLNSDSISAGQRQLLTIARGMIKDAPFLILDEATSNVDTRTEELVQKAMDKLTKGKTSFIIAHRLSTIKNADLILVMQDGNIVEQGNHDELMKLNKNYAKLYNSQFQL
ncbi:MAG: ABC transporter ATP-binding protein [Bacilli bacterium]|nr:ABC transporter ATP-binding protein [Bacilli bacterium]